MFSSSDCLTHVCCERTLIMYTPLCFVLSLLSTLSTLGESVPPQLLSAALQGQKSFPALDLQGQILYGAVDQVCSLTAVYFHPLISSRKVLKLHS